MGRILTFPKIAPAVAFLFAFVFLPLSPCSSFSICEFELSEYLARRYSGIGRLLCAHATMMRLFSRLSRLANLDVT